MAKIKNINYFKTQSQVGDNVVDNKENYNEYTIPGQNVMPRHVQLSEKLLYSVKDASVKLNDIGFKGLAKDMAGLYRLAVSKRFTVAFVGEFNRGKSTLINKVIGEDILPTANLPTTAILTRVVYGNKPRMTVCGKDGKRIKELPVNLKSWEGLTAANLGEQEPEGYIVIEYNDPWLGKFGIEILDTPGAGDLEEKRAQVIERSMVNADAAIIVIDANKVLSQTEVAFIRQKVISRSVPFVAIAITKLDMIDEKDRADVLDFVSKRLDALKISMPIIVANSDIEIPGIEDKNKGVLIGLDKIKALIVSWMANENRKSLMEKWLSTNALSILNSAHGFLLQQKQIVDAKDEEKERLIRQRTNALYEMHTKWNVLREEMEKRCEKCVIDFNKAASEAGASIVENLQHEADRQPNPKEWLEKEYTYRVKRELSAASLSLDNLVARYVTSDMRWLNGELNKQFKEIVGTEVESLMSREDFIPDVDDKAIKLNNMKDRSTKATIVSSVLTLGAALMLGVTGGAPLILATMGVGTGSNIIARKMLEKEGIRQREALKNLIAQQIPVVIKNASADSETKIKIIYNDIISASHKTESRWLDAQKGIIRSSLTNNDDMDSKIGSQLKSVETLISYFI